MFLHTLSLNDVLPNPNDKPILKTEHPVVIFPSSGTGGWEAALVNTLSTGDSVLMYETGQFSTLWVELATRIGAKPEVIAGDWRHGVDAAAIEERLTKDREIGRAHV